MHVQVPSWSAPNCCTSKACITKELITLSLSNYLAFPQVCLVHGLYYELYVAGMNLATQYQKRHWTGFVYTAVIILTITDITLHSLSLTDCIPCFCCIARAGLASQTGLFRSFRTSCSPLWTCQLSPAGGRENITHNHKSIMPREVGGGGVKILVHWYGIQSIFCIRYWLSANTDSQSDMQIFSTY